MLELLAAAALFTAQPTDQPNTRPDCAAPTGTDALLARPERILVIPDWHGAVEIPAAFLGIVCEAAKQGPVTIALEMPETERVLFRNALSAPTEEAARNTFLYGDFGNPRSTDGRNSLAMLDMMVGFWRLKAAGHDVAIHPFMPVESVIRGRDQAWWELEMAYGISRALANRPEARVLVFVGDLHARKTGYERFPDIGTPAAGHLHASDTFTLTIANQGGATWDCDPNGCGPQTRRGRYDPDARGIILGPVEDGAYDGVLAVGPTTASPPAALQDQPAVTSSGSSS
ncbi:ChaN family lipoprotein [Brevundimonas sp. M20]|uniref:ChaN family lipoprotein n=1 Tax=Brevundimonas sp. M20 TaxID=2591463 RepID=UPI0011474624|nr:ChaN family lipoprotein [Brevundimonas sp. M20]QDH73864.1 ChaN family lipoprotein [Brevundimonas sp. M20]